MGAQLLYDMSNQVFGSPLTDNLSKWMDQLMESVNTILTSLDPLIGAMCGIGCMLMIIYFFMDLTNQASKDMFSFEKLVVAFIRLLVAFAILLYANEIIKNVIGIMEAFKSWMGTVEFNLGGEVNEFELSLTDFQGQYKGIIGNLYAMLVATKLIFPFAISWICELVGMFLTASTMLTLLVRLTLSPLAIVQVFEDGTRSAGIRYIKGLFADAMAFGTMLLILRMAHALGIHMMGNVDFSSVQCIEQMGWGDFAKAIITSLLCVGGMAGASKITHDVLGA